MKVDEIDPHDSSWGPVTGLFTGYLHQDFHDEFGDPWSAVRAFSQEFPLDAVRTAADGIATLLREFPEELEARRAVGHLGLDYVPWVDGWTCRDWLAAVETAVREGAAGR